MQRLLLTSKAELAAKSSAQMIRMKDRCIVLGKLQTANWQNLVTVCQVSRRKRRNGIKWPNGRHPLTTGKWFFPPFEWLLTPLCQWRISFWFFTTSPNWILFSPFHFDVGPFHAAHSQLRFEEFSNEWSMKLPPSSLDGGRDPKHKSTIFLFWVQSPVSKGKTGWSRLRTWSVALVQVLRSFVNCGPGTQCNCVRRNFFRAVWILCFTLQKAQVQLMRNDFVT